MDLPIKAKIVLKHGQQEATSKPSHLSPVHVASGSAHDVTYRVECPVWSKFEESPFDAIQSMSFDGHDFVYSTERKKKVAAENSSAAVEPDFVLKVEKKSSDWCPIRIRVGHSESKETEGEVIFVKPIMSLDGILSMVYNVVLFMNPNSSKIEQRVKAQKMEYLDTAWSNFHVQLLIERRQKLLELCRELQLKGVSFGEESSNSSSDELPTTSYGEESSSNRGNEGSN